MREEEPFWEEKLPLRKVKKEEREKQEKAAAFRKETGQGQDYQAEGNTSTLKEVEQEVLEY